MSDKTSKIQEKQSKNKLYSLIPTKNGLIKKYAMFSVKIWEYR